MYLSRLTLLPDQTEKVFDLIRGGLYAEHQLMWKFFSGDSKAERDFLYRRFLLESLTLVVLTAFALNTNENR